MPLGKLSSPDYTKLYDPADVEKTAPFVRAKRPRQVLLHVPMVTRFVRSNWVDQDASHSDGREIDGHLRKFYESKAVVRNVIATKSSNWHGSLRAGQRGDQGNQFV